MSFGSGKGMLKAHTMIVLSTDLDEKKNVIKISNHNEHSLLSNTQLKRYYKRSIKWG